MLSLDCVYACGKFILYISMQLTYIVYIGIP